MADDLHTSNISLISHAHGRQRRLERGIERRELQAAMRYGVKQAANPGPSGEPRWRFTHQNTVYITDATCRHEITSWKVGPSTLASQPPGEYGVHLVLVVDKSGSMRNNDVPGFADRTQAVYECLARDLFAPQLAHGWGSAQGSVVVSLIEFDDAASIVFQERPLDTRLGYELRARGEVRARSHGNYLPALDEVQRLLASTAPGVQVMLIFLSDGAPSDHIGMACQHGEYVWLPQTQTLPARGQRGKTTLRQCPTGQQACRYAVQMHVHRHCSFRILALAKRFPNRLSLVTIGFGKPDEEYRVLQTMAASLKKRGQFSKLGLQAAALRTTFNSLSSSLTSLRSDAAGGAMPLTLRNLTVQPAGVPHRPTHVTDADYVIARGAVAKFVYNSDTNTLSRVPFSASIAFEKLPFAEGAERFVHRGSEITRDTLQPISVAIVTKQSRFRELLYDLSFHTTFCRLHDEADKLARSFSRVAAVGMPAFQVRFVQCCIYRCTRGPDLPTITVLAEPELEGLYIKYNNNAGGVRAARGGAGGLGHIVEEEGEPGDPAGGSQDPGGGFDVNEVPQAFSHFSYDASGGAKLVCDLQGVWNETDGFTLTDPVIHLIGGPKSANGATDKGADGALRFFETHVCGPFCQGLGLTARNTCIRRVRIAAERAKAAARTGAGHAGDAPSVPLGGAAQRQTHQMLGTERGRAEVDALTFAAMEATPHAAGAEWHTHAQSGLGGAVRSSPMGSSGTTSSGMNSMLLNMQPANKEGTRPNGTPTPGNPQSRKPEGECTIL